MRQNLLLDAVDIIQSDLPLAQRRLEIGQCLLELLHADMYVSYVNNADGPFSDPLDLNLGAESLQAYDDHFRFVDGVTPTLLRRRGASRISVDGATGDEFIRDFLQRRNLHHGMNFFARNMVPGSVDLRVWRSKSGGMFTEDDVHLLNVIGGLIERLWPTTSTGAGLPLTPREREIAALVSHGLSDREICAELSISHATLRTHLAHAFEKTGVRNRAGLAREYLQDHH